MVSRWWRHSLHAYLLTDVGAKEAEGLGGASLPVRRYLPPSLQPIISNVQGEQIHFNVAPAHKRYKRSYHSPEAVEKQTKRVKDYPEIFKAFIERQGELERQITGKVRGTKGGKEWIQQLADDVAPPPPPPECHQHGIEDVEEGYFGWAVSGTKEVTYVEMDFHCPIKVHTYTCKCGQHTYETIPLDIGCLTAEEKGSEASVGGHHHRWYALSLLHQLDLQIYSVKRISWHSMAGNIIAMHAYHNQASSR